MATIVSKWQVEPVAGSPLETRASVNLTPLDLRLRLVRRASPGDAHEPPPIQAGGRLRPNRQKVWRI
ncbi:hypothetical protein [Lentzea aerocolonigenes]|uniref:hypothetical protein n=1 Tax=Lentzea aerocolonigenes TaxID=68170 RepID=UPI0012E23E62|nr:hypothetical protein [Lentzea aerocolonigenes]